MKPVNSRSISRATRGRAARAFAAGATELIFGLISGIIQFSYNKLMVTPDPLRGLRKLGMGSWSAICPEDMFWPGAAGPRMDG